MEASGGAGHGVRVRVFEVEGNYAGWRLDRYLMQKIGRLTRSQLGKVVRSGLVEVERPGSGQCRIKPGLKMKGGDLVRVSQVMREEVVQDDEVAVLLAERDLIILNKPAGMLMHPTASAFQNTVMSYVHRRGEDDETWRGVQSIHRLDRETSGVVLLARGLPAQRRISAKFELGQMEKLYLALVEDPRRLYQAGDEGQTAQPLGFDSASILPLLKVAIGEWSAHTSWRCLRRGGEADDIAALLIRIEGGRQHQIRAHMALLGTPVLGDKLYGHGDVFYKDYLDGVADLSALRAPRQMLHAWRLSFSDEGRAISVIAPIPSLFSAIMEFEGWELGRGL